MSALLLRLIVFASWVAGGVCTSSFMGHDSGEPDAMSGHSSCPCITYEEGVNDTLGVSARNVSELEKLSYGIGCGPHDGTALFLPECNMIGAPGYCHDSWCYVEKSCSVHRSASTFRLGRYLSYGTCGYVGQDTNLTDENVINVMFLSNSGGWMGSYCKEGFPTCDGPAAEILNAVLAATGAKINVLAKFYGGTSRRRTIQGVFPSQVLDALDRDLPNETRASWPCWYATGMGYVDLCLYAGTSMSPRLAISSSLPLYSEPMYLITSEQVVELTIWDLLGSSFTPFTATTWVAIFAFIMLLSNILAWQEHFHEGSFENMPWLYCLGHASYLGIRSFVDQAVIFEPRNLGGRLTSLSLGFFLLVTIAAYTANLAAALILKPQPGLLVSSWSDLLRNPANKLCTKGSVAEYLQKAPWNLPVEQVVTFESRDAVFPSIGSACVAAVASMEDLVKARATGKFCNLERVGDPLYYAERAAPVSKRAAGLLQYHLAKVHESGKWRDTIGKWESVLSKPCVEPVAEVGVKIHEMLGPFIISSFLGALGVIATCLRVNTGSTFGGFHPKAFHVPADEKTTNSASCKEQQIERSMSEISCDARSEESQIDAQISPTSPEKSRAEPHHHRHHLDISREELHKLKELQKKLSNSLEGVRQLPQASWQKSAIRAAAHPWRNTVDIDFASREEPKELDKHGRQASRPVQTVVADTSPEVIMNREQV